MDLKDFVAVTLAAIVDGVVQAQANASPKGAHVNPGGLMRTTRSISNDALWDNATNNFARLVNFDVALSVEEGTMTSAKVGVVAGILNLGAGGESANKQLVVSRVQFSVPLLFPVSALPQTAREPR
jgi:hypothetical protein